MVMWDRDGIELVLFSNDGSQVRSVTFLSGSFTSSLSAVGEATVNVPRSEVVA